MRYKLEHALYEEFNKLVKEWDDETGTVRIFKEDDDYIQIEITINLPFEWPGVLCEFNWKLHEFDEKSNFVKTAKNKALAKLTIS